MSDKPTRIILESNLGGLPMILCACGVLLFETMQNGHLEHCIPYIEAAAAQESE